MYQALYRSFRPETFSGILGQEHIVRILQNQIKGQTTSHAYLFCGTRGTGKTSTARILAKGVNCTGPEGSRPCGECENCRSIKNGTFMDVVEIDAASNNGVENIRELRESVKYPPAVGRCKVYIIDEVHMLSTGAFNALLKTLEEPPRHVMFILATTEVQKLPATILSRCLRLDFHRIAEKELRAGMRDICAQLDIKISDAALGLIAAGADGSVRDGLSLLDQCIATGEGVVSREDVLSILGTAGEETFMELTDLVATQQVGAALLLLDHILAEGKDARQFLKDWIAHFRNLLITKYISNPADILNMSAENVERIRRQSDQLDLSVINEAILELSKAANEAKWSSQPRILLELSLVKLAAGSEGVPMKQAVPATPVSVKKSKPQANGERAQSENPKPQAKQERSPGESTVDLDELWHKVLEDGEALKGSFNLLRVGTALRSVGQERFKVEVANLMQKKYATENSATLSQLMEKYTHRHLQMECVLPKEDTVEDDTEALAKSIGKRLGLNIEIQ